jgi:hypothetical protein
MAFADSFVGSLVDSFVDSLAASEEHVASVGSYNYPSEAFAPLDYFVQGTHSLHHN